MTTSRTPVVLGLHRATGTTTVAAALHAHDGGSRAAAADLVLCAGTEESLLRAGALAVGGARPWLAVVMVGAGRAPARGRLRLASRRCAGFTLLPHVGPWAGLTRPVDDLPMVLGLRPDQVPPPLRAYAAGLRAIAAGLVRTGLLDQARPPVVAAARSGGATPPVPVRVVPPGRPAAESRPALRSSSAAGFHPVAAAHPTVLPAPSRVGSATEPDEPDELDDEALELAVQLIGTR